MFLKFFSYIEIIVQEKCEWVYPNHEIKQSCFSNVTFVWLPLYLQVHNVQKCIYYLSRGCDNYTSLVNSQHDIIAPPPRLDQRGFMCWTFWEYSKQKYQTKCKRLPLVDILINKRPHGLKILCLPRKNIGRLLLILW